MSGYCSNCGTPLEHDDAGSCPECGVQIHPPEKKSVALAAICSFLIPGLGQVYNGDLKRGFGILLGTAIGTVLLLIPGLIVWLYGIYDAYKTAQGINAGEVPFRENSGLKMVLFVGLWFVASIVAGTLMAAIMVFMTYAP
ncbi:TM2 domain-containing membrane protein YozV [Methanofollis sp. W23]|uniref:hypothetical protein n=1 Tax=Methanofollis sp. W23 TaxID=2817849 RepID=UPI001AE40CF2|nr:hypothetical protein [Methanofollis sp. W23]MBP2145103.1 TM2 domain-containing membrane protein YozV [Methanofollis sp. W23]